MRHPQILKALDGVTKAKARLKSTLARVQHDCKHTCILHAATRPSNWGGGSPMGPIRLCLNCGIEEQLQPYREYQWGTVPKLKLTSEFVKVVTHDELFKERIT